MCRSGSGASNSTRPWRRTRVDLNSGAARRCVFPAHLGWVAFPLVSGGGGGPGSRRALARLHWSWRGWEHRESRCLRAGAGRVAASAFVLRRGQSGGCGGSGGSGLGPRARGERAPLAAAQSWAGPPGSARCPPAARGWPGGAADSEPDPEGGASPGVFCGSSYSSR